MIILLRRRSITGKWDYMVLIIHYFKKRRMEGFQEGIFGFPHLKNIIDLQPRYWCDHLGMINESVGERNNFENEAGKKQVVRRFSKKEF